MSSTLHATESKLHSTIGKCCRMTQELRQHLNASLLNMRGFRDRVSSLIGALDCCNSVIRRQVNEACVPATDHVDHPTDSYAFKLGFGSPGRTGCLDVAGTTVLFNQMFTGNVSILEAMRELDIHAVGLPGARLQQNFTLPPSLNCGLFCIFRNTFRDCFHLLSNVGVIEECGSRSKSLGSQSCYGWYSTCHLAQIKGLKSLGMQK